MLRSMHSSETHVKRFLDDHGYGLLKYPYGVVGVLIGIIHSLASADSTNSSLGTRGASYEATNGFRHQIL